jgi:hypothetical protein
MPWQRPHLLLRFLVLSGKFLSHVGLRLPLKCFNHLRMRGIDRALRIHQIGELPRLSCSAQTAFANGCESLQFTGI